MFSKKQIPNTQDIISELTDIESRLERYIDTTLWISDPHGAGERFVQILKGRFGLVWRSAYEALPKTFSNETLEYLDRIIRKEKFFEQEGITMERQDVISSLVKIIRYKVYDIHQFDSMRVEVRKTLRPIVENLVLNFPVPNIIYENTLISDIVISSLCRIAKHVILNQLIVLGDVFDRGDEPDKILRILSKKELKDQVKFVWGNHDILWMGAAAGNRSLIAEALRISVRYDNLEFLARMDIDISNLKELAIKLYPDVITGNFKAKLDIAKKMEKTLAVIQFKLEEEMINKYPQLEMESRLNLVKLAELLKSGNIDGLTDTHFPTIDLDTPLVLTEDEKKVIDDLAVQFTSSNKIKRLMKYLFEEGKIYHLNNYILNIHALIPSTEKGEFDTLYGKKGKDLFKHLEATIKNIGQTYLEGGEQEPFQHAVMFYLWCGPKSPFFGKHAMKTFERYFYKDKATHKEQLLYWGENIKNKEFMDKILNEFGAKRIVYGHTPVDIMKGEKLSSPDGRAINIDGGFSGAYLDRGHSLIMTPYSIYAIILPTPQEIADATEKKEPAKLLFEEIDTFENPIKIKDTFTGIQLKKRSDELLEMLKKAKE